MNPTWAVVSFEGTRVRYRTKDGKWSSSAKDANGYLDVVDARADAQRRHIDNAQVALSWVDDAASEAVEGE